VELVTGEEIQLSDTVRIESVEAVERGDGGPVATIHFSDGRAGKVGTAHLVTHVPTVGHGRWGGIPMPNLIIPDPRRLL